MAYYPIKTKSSRKAYTPNAINSRYITTYDPIAILLKTVRTSSFTSFLVAFSEKTDTTSGTPQERRNQEKTVSCHCNKPSTGPPLAASPYIAIHTIKSKGPATNTHKAKSRYCKYRYVFKSFDFILTKLYTNYGRKTITMNNKQNLDDMLNLCKGAQDKGDVQGWQTLKQYNNTSPNKQFDVTVYQKGKTVVLAFAGTERNPVHKSDVKNDAIILTSNNIPRQYGDAQRLYEQIKKDYKGKGVNIEFTGYSLGGTLANLLSHHSGKPSTAFTPIGSKHIAQANPDHFKYDDSNIKTYGVKGDWLFESNLNKQSGEIYVAPALPMKRDISGFKDDHPYLTGGVERLAQQKNNVDLNYHMIENFSPELFQKAQKIGTSKDFALPNDKNGVAPAVAGKIYTAEEIGKMSSGEFKKYESAIDEQMKRIGVPREQEAKQAVQNGGMVYVKHYTRADGTEVKGYYRSR